MAKDIRQSVSLPAPAEKLFEMYVDAERHSAFTGAPVTIGREPGDRFEAFGGALSGHMIATVPARLVVQAWRSTNFGDDDPDSTLVLSFADEAGGGRIDLVHVGVAERDVDGVREGWEKYYWTPWRAYLDKKP